MEIGTDSWCNLISSYISPGMHACDRFKRDNDNIKSMFMFTRWSEHGNCKTVTPVVACEKFQLIWPLGRFIVVWLYAMLSSMKQVWHLKVWF